MTNLTAREIAHYFIHIANESGSLLTSLKLQKLVFYAQAWHLALFDQPLFEEDFEAWVHGPVIPSLQEEYQHFGWQPILQEVTPPPLSEECQAFLAEVTEVYFFRDALELEMMTHREAPWLEARQGLPLEAASTAVITKESMQKFYKGRLHEKD